MTTDTASHSAGREFRENGFLLLAALLGSMFMSSHAFTNGVFLDSWRREFGWTAGQISAAVSFSNAGLILFPPLVGRLVDRYGVRRPTLVFLGLLPLAFAAFTQIGPELWTLYAAYFLFGVIGAGSGFVPFTRAISEYFDKGRGLALGIACSATSLCALVTPLLANQLLKAFGWREAWLGLALAAAFIWPIVFFGLKEVRPVSAPRPELDARAAARGFAELARDRSFRIIAIAFILVTFAALGLVVQMVPYLKSVGFTQDQAVASATGIALGLGVARVAAGLLLDRIFGPRVFLGVCLLGIGGCAALVFGNAPAVVLGVVMVGMVMGAEGDIMAYLASRYFGLLDYAKAYGLLFGLMGFGSMTAPALNAYIYEATGSFTYNIALAALALLLSGLLVSFLPAYPDRAPAPARGWAARDARATPSVR